MAFTDINSEDRLVQKTFADHLEKALGWESIYAWNDEKFGPDGTLGRADTREVVLTRDLLPPSDFLPFSVFGSRICPPSASAVQFFPKQG